MKVEEHELQTQKSNEPDVMWLGYGNYGGHPLTQINGSRVRSAEPFEVLTKQLPSSWIVLLPLLIFGTLTSVSMLLAWVITAVYQLLFL